MDSNFWISFHNILRGCTYSSSVFLGVQPLINESLDNLGDIDMPKIQTDDINRFFEYGISISTKTIYIGSLVGGDEESGVDSAMAEYAVKGLHILDNLETESHKEKPITIMLNTLGGYVSHGFAIYDAIMSCKNQTRIIAYGQVMSMGSVIFQAADTRIMMPRSIMMIHYGLSSLSESHAPTVYKWADENKRQDKIVDKIYLNAIRKKHPRFTTKKLNDWLMADTFFNPKEAIYWGLADEIGEGS